MTSNYTQPMGISLGREMTDYAVIVHPNEFDQSHSVVLPFKQDTERFLYSEATATMVGGDGRTVRGYNDYYGFMSAAVTALRECMKRPQPYRIKITISATRYAVIPHQSARERTIYLGEYRHRDIPRGYLVLDDGQTVADIENFMDRSKEEDGGYDSALKYDRDDNTVLIFVLDTRDSFEENKERILAFLRTLRDMLGFDAQEIERVDRALVAFPTIGEPE